MDCSLFDFGCHAQSAIWQWWAALGFAKQAMIIAGLLLIVGGSLLGVLQFVKKIGGWPAVAGAALLIVVGVLSVIPQKPKGRQPAQVEVEDEDPVPSPRKKPRVRTALDWLKKFD